MGDFLRALKILSKYMNPGSHEWARPFSCDHDILYVTAVNPRDVSQDDIDSLEKLGFTADIYEQCFYSYKYGSS